MPELPEVEAVTQRLRQAAPWAEIVARGQYRPTTMSGAEQALGRRIEGVERRGKHILVQLSGGAFLRVHLKMTGNLVVLPDYRLLPVTVRAWFGLSDGRCVALNDPRALGRISFHRDAERAELLAGLGPEPFDAAFTPARLVAEASKTVKPIKPWLMEQRVVTGLGNIYAAEALFQARVHPAARSCDVKPAGLRRLHGAIVDVLRSALDSAIAAYEQPGGFTEGENYPVAVYGREGEACYRCRTPIERLKQAGRSTYFCPRCQR